MPPRLEVQMDIKAMEARREPWVIENLRESGLTNATIENMRVEEVESREALLAVLGFSKMDGESILQASGAYTIPYPNGSVRCRLRFPLNGAKYLTRKGDEPAAYYVCDKAKLESVKCPLVICEGEKKAAKVQQEADLAGIPCCAVSVPGITMWGCLDKIKLRMSNRKVFIAFDNEYHLNQDLCYQAFCLYCDVYAKKGLVTIARWVDGKGIDDALMVKDQTLQNILESSIENPFDIFSLPAEKMRDAVAKSPMTKLDIETMFDCLDLNSRYLCPKKALLKGVAEKRSRLGIEEVTAGKTRPATSAEILGLINAVTENKPIKLNDLTEFIEVGTDRVDDTMIATINVDVRDLSLERHLRFSREDTFEVLLKEAGKHRHNPIKEWADSLPRWDGKDHVAQLATYIKEKNGMFRRWFEVWGAQMFRKIYTAMHGSCLVLLSNQELGKGFFCKWLASEMGKQYYLDQLIDVDDKDCRKRLASIGVWEISELSASLKKNDAAALKYFISLEEVQLRLPYAHYDIVKPSIASFIATANPEGPLFVDPSGNRRFLLCELESINWTYTEHVDRTQLFAQLKSAYVAGRDVLSVEEKEIRTEHNATQTVVCSVEVLLQSMYKVVANPSAKISLSNILVALSSKGIHPTRATQMAIALAMEKMGSKCVREMCSGTRIRFYTNLESIAVHI